MTLTRTGATVHAVLSGALCVPEVASLHRQLVAELHAEACLVVDAGAVTRLDASVAQLFLFASGRCREFRVEGASAAWRATWGALGLPHSLSAV